MATKKFMEALRPVRVIEQGQVFETGRPVTFRYIRNAKSSTPKHIRGTPDLYQQDIEPAGRYMLTDPDPTGSIPRGWEQGVAHFTSPLVIDFGKNGYDDDSWKVRLHQFFKAKKRALSTKIRRAGYDGIVTVSRGETQEIVDLSGKP